MMYQEIKNFSNAIISSIELQSQKSPSPVIGDTKFKIFSDKIIYGFWYLSYSPIMLSKAMILPQLCVSEHGSGIKL